MKIKYFYQQLASHFSVIIIAFLILSLLFSHFVEQFVYDNKTEELATYGKSILSDIEQVQGSSREILKSYGHVLEGRDIQYSLFNEKSAIIYSTGLKTPLIELNVEEWRELQNGKAITVKQEYKRFEQDVTYVLLPYFHRNQFVGGILLTSPIKGSREIISQMNSYLIYTTFIALTIALLLSGILSTFHGRRIKRLRSATANVAQGNYNVRIPTEGIDEIGELAGDFNGMVEKLAASAEEIENLENRRRQFMADVSHELRTPLTTIRGIIEGLRNDMISESEKERGLHLASNETMRLIRLVNENLDYEKIRSNQVVLLKQKIQLGELLEIIQEQLEDVADERGDKIIVEVSQEVSVFADYDRLTQVLINITKNSIQFTENGVIRLRGYTRDDRTVIEIEDTGIGMDPLEIEKIWGRFYKAIDSRTTNPYGEFGLGLSIVKQLVTLHGGTITVESVKGEGTRFRIELPMWELP
ncbi:HAMP domain-containing sensor histidine kinase [Sporosarcina thermotolerans]|uniref:histidine kinase n=1 Tax=Sporosarcina thermotolerans TaxID=633404 RepID=A0AAW9A6W3_9BACL|nr:HAMP domain-containing sensor histidine kinase [Sporosarcina thermotolerans]MDW0116699.1 HAMP domain-containing sensor histidine kinase [Sporosarcina thermotolerans]WHT48892.1 HAMP domain-containing sensor histidine kinase [Sporosarcina thermotolerans]